MPVFLLFVILEKWADMRRGISFRPMDTISSLTSGVTNVTKDVLGLSIALYTYSWMVHHIAVFHVKAVVLTYIIAFIALDLAGYIVHRIQHSINLFWNGHIVHHSSEEFDLACALRQSVSSLVKIFAVFLLPAALLGVPEKVIAIVAPLHLFAQFWYHTVHINKMGVLEKIIVTPSHHRVHHAFNAEYMDKNFGQIFIFWDKVFGTFQEELPEVKPVFGITRPVRTWNPFKINFQHAALLMKDAWRANNWKDKIRIWFMPTGWRPADVSEKYPVYKIDDVYNFEKYRREQSKPLIMWSVFQLLMLLLMVSWLFGNISRIGSPCIFIYGGFVFLFVYAFTELMDRNRYAVYWESLKGFAGIAIIYYYEDWFGLSSSVSFAHYILVGYFILSMGVAYFFTRDALNVSHNAMAA